MKYMIALKRYSVFMLLLTVFASCEKQNDFRDPGIIKIYMPQAGVLNGGISNNYPVPFNTGNQSTNYFLDSANNMLIIPLGVKNGGVQDLGSYSVKVVANYDTTNTIVTNQSIAKSVALPAGTYTLPETVTVESGKSEAVFYLKIDINKLNQDYPLYFKRFLVLGVSITDPTKGVLDTALSTTVVVIDAFQFMKTPPPNNIIKGAEFDAGSENIWKIIIQNDFRVHKRPTITVANGVLSYKNGTTHGYSNNAIYQPIQVVQGKRYQFSMDIKTSGYINNSWIEIYIGKNEPTPSTSYSDYKFIAMDNWNKNGFLKSPMSGNFVTLANIGPGKATNGIFTAPLTGTMYLVIRPGSSDGSIENLELDNVKLLEIFE